MASPRVIKKQHNCQFRNEAEHLRAVLEKELAYRKKLEALLRSHGVDPLEAKKIPDETREQPPQQQDSQQQQQQQQGEPEPFQQQQLTSEQVGKILDEVDKEGWQSDLRGTIRTIRQILRPPKGVEVRFRNVTWSVTVPRKSQTIPTVGGQLLSIVRKPIKALTRTQDLITKNILHDLNGVLKPSQMTLVLGKPGSGKSSFLNLISDELHRSKNYKLTGSVTFNGVEHHSKAFNIRRVVSHIRQHDSHLPTLTVAETLSFAFAFQDDAALFQRIDPTSVITRGKLIAAQRKVKIRHILKIFGLEHVQDTLVGNEMIRGISGGQRKRVTVCEMIMGLFRVILGDQISTGLDSSTTFDIVSALKTATQEMDVTTAISLLQPPPEVYHLFDQVIVLDDGEIIYMGPVSTVTNHFTETLGFRCPRHKDTADFLQEVTSVEAQSWWEQTDKCVSMPEHNDFVSFYHESDQYKQIMEHLDQLPPTPEWGPETQHEYLQPWRTSTKLVVIRQMQLLARNKQLVRAQIGQSTVMGLLIGSLFWNLADTEYANRYGLFFLTSMMLALGGMPSLPVMCAERSIFYKQSDAAFFPTSSYVVAQAISALPINILQVVIFGSLAWWMCGLTDETNGSRFGAFLAVSLALSVAVNQLLRSISSIAPNAEAATPLAGCAIVFMILFSGFIIQEDNIPDYWIWVYWLNPVAWSLRAYAVLEFTSPKYDTISPSGTRIGDLYLDVYGFRKSTTWIWAAILYLIGLFIFQMFVSFMMLSRVRQTAKPKPPSYGDVSASSVSSHAKSGLLGPSAVEMTVPQSVSSPQADQTQADDALDDDASSEPKSVLPFTPATLTFKDIWYTVTISGQGARHAEKLDLLQGVTGFALPGTLTALMGSSGAGKTTLLDVISGRKTSGQIRGDICVNGKPKDRSFARLAGYVEQMDIHSPRSTVFEALLFSARLRLPPSVDKLTRVKFVNDIAEMLELTPLKQSPVGIEGESGLTTEQRKRLTIGVELVANPSIIFLDEPTSGLDSRAAAIVMRVVKNIAKTNRTIVCTIHQPSAYLFEMFDNLLLLKKGGRTVYFGPLGEHSVDLVKYLESIPGSFPITEGANPATYMLDVIGAGTSAQSTLSVDAAEYYAKSQLNVANEAEFAKASQTTQSNSANGHAGGTYAVSMLVQASELITKALTSYWRSPSYNVTRMAVSALVAFVFGSVYKRSKVNSQSDVIARFSVIFVASAFTCVVYMTSVIPTVVTERAVFYRERAARMYSTIPYTLSFTIAEIPYIVFNTLCFSVVFYFTVGLYDDGAKFGYFWLYYMLVICVATFAGQMFACIAPDAQAATIMAMLMMNVWVSFCGFMISPGNIPQGWKFMYWYSPFHYLLEGIVTTQFHDEHKMISVVTSSGPVLMTVEQYADLHFGHKFQYSHRGIDVIALVVILVGFNVIRALALKFINTMRR